MDIEFVDNLVEVFGKKKTKKIIKEIKTLKKNNPGVAFSFVFDETGKFKATPKK